MSDYWFTPKTHGYGATPSNWKGWAATGAFVALLTTLSVMPTFGMSSAAGPTAWQLAARIAVGLVLTAGFVALARAKTDGQWRWRWGK